MINFQNDKNDTEICDYTSVSSSDQKVLIDSDSHMSW